MDMTESARTAEFVEDELPSMIYRPSQDYIAMGPQYVPHRGLVRYSQALKHLIPVRKQAKRNNILNIDKAGFFSFVTYSWMTKYIWQAYKRGLTVDDIPQGSPYDACDFNAQRLEYLWRKEVDCRGARSASLGRVIWQFARTRLLLASFTFSISCVMGFLSPTIFMRKLLEFCERDDSTWQEGVVWAVALATSELMRTLFFCMCWSISYRTATRLRAACLAMVYRKILTLHSLGHKSAGEMINLFANDGPRLFYMVVFGPMIVGGPLVAICGVVYILAVLGPWALLGMLTFTFFYPLQYGLSHLSGYYRGRAIKAADHRVKHMTELLNCIKLIKMYAWEEAFSTQIHKSRKEEVREIRKTAYCQSLGITMAPTVPVISGIVTFVAHVLAGGNLTASQGFSVLSLIGKSMRMALHIVKDGLLAIHEGIISLPRFQAFPVLTFTSKQLRMALKHLAESCNSWQEGLVAIPRFKAFPLVTILTSQLRAALMNVRYGTENLLVGALVFSRIQELLLMEELKVAIEKPSNAQTALEVVKGTFLASSQASPHTENNKKKGKRKKMDSPVRNNETVLETGERDKLNVPEQSDGVTLLSDVSFSVPKGSLVGVCGAVGAGKSSLLLACLGQLKMAAGRLLRDGSVAYVSQQAWIQNATLKENIVFGEAFNAKRYINAVYCCALNDDIHLLPGGDETEIGERGVNLSGGQKQRVALARALYANRDVYLLDDPLSAVDAHVAAHIMEHAILTALRSRTVILVTHQVAHLSQCDNVVVMKSGRLVAQGPHTQLLQQSPDYRLIVQATEFSDVNLASDLGSQLRLDHLPTSTSPPASDSNKSPLVERPLRDSNIKQVPDGKREERLPGDSYGKQPMGIKPEEQLRGEVRGYAYAAYMRAAGGPLVSFLALLVIMINTGINAFSSYWLALWIRQGGGNATVEDPITNSTVPSKNISDNPDLSWYMSIYVATIGFVVVSSLVRSVTVTRAAVRAGKKLHDALFGATLRSPMHHFETTPQGRILNMFARDLDETESRLPFVLETMIQNIWMVAFAFLFICMVFPWFLLPLFVLLFLYYFISKIFRVAVRDLQRMDNISRAPVLSAVSASIQGLPTIHAFGKEKDFLTQFSTTFDDNSTCLFMNCNAMRWMATRLDSISVIVTCITALMVVLLKGQVPAALAGLALTYAAHISGVFQYTIRLLSETEARFISVERMQTAIQTLVPEGRGSSSAPPPGWPSRGAIRFKDVCLSYGDDLPPILNSFSLSIRAGEKLGVVGRTGAGKSSMITALFRLCELSRGVITIDGVDISQLDLLALRQAMAVIPQDPVLFNGSFRHNLDPFGQHSDTALWDAVRKTQLEGKVLGLEGGLEAVVGEGGDCLSVGERQLLCLARALLRGCKILVLDEATASVDPETEQAIQQTIRTEFVSSTVIIIAHRLATVTSTNRVLLMDHGSVVELDDPAVLLSDRSSQFAKLASSVGFIPPT